MTCSQCGNWMDDKGEYFKCPLCGWMAAKDDTWKGFQMPSDPKVGGIEVTWHWFRFGLGVVATEANTEKGETQSKIELYAGPVGIKIYWTPGLGGKVETK